jgi:hypothetical protein
VTDWVNTHASHLHLNTEAAAADGDPAKLGFMADRQGWRAD